MATYIYESVTEPVEINIDPQWLVILEGADIDEQLAERSHIRPDHKYAPGEPVSFDSLEYLGGWVKDPRDGISEVELSMDLERALQPLTELQRRYYKLNRLKGYSLSAIAKDDGKQASTIFRLVESADRKIKNYFS
ncbi:MAG: hypothetical protein FWC62_02715 [Firmicutes bacterium]|nr:hypothetical protein [Bacillota bacterium]